MCAGCHGQVRGTNPKNLYDVFQDMVLFNGAFSWDLTCQVGAHTLHTSRSPALSVCL